MCAIAKEYCITLILQLAKTGLITNMERRWFGGRSVQHNSALFFQGATRTSS